MIDDLLRTDAARWRADEAPFPDLDDAVASARRTSWATPRWPVVGAAASVAAVAAGTVALSLAQHPTSRPDHATAAVTHARASTLPVPSSIRVGGSQVPYAGTVPWSDAVLDPHDPRVLYVEADGDSINAEGVCGVPAERVSVTETAQSVRILVAGYAKRSRTGCLAVGHAPQRQRVVLAQPIGARRLVDASDGRTHVALDASAVPTVTAPLAGCVAAPLSWDESARIATRGCRGVTSVTLDDGPSGAYAADRGEPRGTRSGPYAVGAARALVWRADSNDPDIDDVRWVVQWRVSPGRQLTLTIDTTRESGLTREQVLAIARSVR